MQKVAQFPIHEAKRIQHLLRDSIAIELRHDDKTCSSGCTVTVEVWVEDVDTEKFFEFVQAEEKALLDDVNWDAAEAEIDLNAETAICPACTSEFSPKTGECSTCGLRFF